MKSTGRITFFFLLRESISLLPQFIPIAIHDIFSFKEKSAPIVICPLLTIESPIYLFWKGNVCLVLLLLESNYHVHKQSAVINQFQVLHEKNTKMIWKRKKIYSVDILMICNLLINYLSNKLIWLSWNYFIFKFIQVDVKDVNKEYFLHWIL